MGAFLSACADKYRLAGDYHALHRWSVEQPGEFWGELANFCDVKFSQPADEIFVAAPTLQAARWFVGARLNYAENVLRHADARPALICRDETGRRQQVSRAELAARVRDLAASLRAAGLQPGDRVAAILPNGPEAVVIMLAAAAIGAIYTSCSPDFGAPAIVDRFAQTAPKILFGCDGYSYAGKRIDCRAGFAAVAAQLPGLQQRVLVRYADLPDEPDNIGGFTDFAELFTGELLQEFVQLPFDHPLFIMYSSGTTGKPKCIVHSAGGTLLQHLKEHVLHTGLRDGERLFYFTTCGWMMWNWLVGALATGAAILLYDGSPFFPGQQSLWQMARDEQVTVFGTSPRFLRATARADVFPDRTLHLPRLRTILSTGSPLPAESYDFVRDRIGPVVQLCSISGGTDIISCFVLGNPLLPVRRGEIQSAGLGMAVDVFDSSGKPLRGQAGELVCTRPFPSMPLGFWGDPDGTQFEHSYFRKFAGCWAQGDLAVMTDAHSFRILGRSDATLNPGGVRMGSAEIVDPAMTVAGIADAVAVGQRTAAGERVVLFVVTAAGVELDDELRATVNAAIRAAASPRHVPAKILEVADIPRTVSGKTVELAIRAVIHGEDVPDTGALANPEALQYFAHRAELAG